VTMPISAFHPQFPSRAESGEALFHQNTNSAAY